ncbi:Cna B-type domain-containing protein [uncultured Clostridium sp.]|uniref:Cna B-type domain-containing protein n=1 Tax=uncultured Clostridium sp. TaxID=59620 RepID=UPI0025D6C6D1|nr:Cna B-type domain-containing protein [uncultured Clostridium sp.]
MIKKIISRILTVTLVASCITVASNKSIVEAEELSTISSSSQILEVGGENKVDLDKVTTSKIITETGVENEFEITLKVTTEENLKNLTLSPDAATVLVLDRSGSMLDEDSDNISRFKEMQDAANSFLTEYGKTETVSNSKRLISIVSFASNVKNETYNNDDNDNNWIDVSNSSKDLIKAKDIINKIEKPIENTYDTRRGTNIEGALIMANNIVKDGKTKGKLLGNNGKEIKNINIILLTDGCPTFYAKNSDKDSIIAIEGIRGGGDEAYTTDWKPVGGSVEGVLANSNNISKIIKESSINLYTIAFSTKNEKFYKEDFYEDAVYLNPSTWMETFATRNFSANNVDILSKQFEKINKIIALSAKAWKVTDPMGENIIYNNVIDTSSDNVYSFENNTLIWDLKNSSPVESKTELGNKKFTYTLKYKLALDTTDKSKNIDYYKSVATNGETILNYYLFSKQDQDESVELKQTNFKIPKVRGLFGDTSFKKLNEKNEGITDVLFNLNGIATGSNKHISRDIISDASGKVTLSNIPAGAYKLTETAPNGYVAKGPWDIVVSYGNVTKDSELKDTVINYPKFRDIQVEKTWTGLPEDQENLPESVTIRLYANEKDTGKTLILNKDNSWQGIFDKLPFVDNSGIINYSVKEDTIAGYTAKTLKSEDKNKFTITNSYNPELISISGIKTWVDNEGENIEGIVPDIEITLQRTVEDNWNDESKVENVETITLSSGKSEYKFTNLPKTATISKAYKYRVREVKVKGYESKYNNDNFNIENIYTPGETELTVNKEWENIDMNNDTLPEVNVVLYRNNEVYDNSIILNNQNKYTYKYTNLPKYDTTGAEYEYTVKEKMKDGIVGYSSKEKTNADGSITIINTFNNEKISITCNKIWTGITKDSVVPAIKLRLYQNGVEMVDEYGIIDNGIKEDGKDKYVFKNLPKYSTDGKEYVYTIKEDSINGYTSSGEANESNNYTIINIYDGGEKVVISGKKTWVNVKDINKVPDITLRVLRDGKEIHSIIVPSGTTTYKIDLASIVKYASDGHEYIYSLTEDKIDGFKSESDGYNFTNTNTNTIKEEVSSISEIKTGDNNKMFLYISLLSISLSLGLIISLRKIKKTLSK